jgi:hypothetical protein
MKRKVIVRSLLVIITTTVVQTIPASAASLSADELYVNAYSKTVAAMSTKTQKSINEARLSIETLKGTGASWAIGEFSQQVDQVQHPILVNVVESINKAEATLKQADINLAKESIDPELPAEWRNSYSSATDIIQQKLMQNVIAVINRANENGFKGDIATASALVEEVKTSNDSNIVSWAEAIKKKLNTTPKYDAPRFTEGVITASTKYKDVLSVKIDRNKLPESMKKFTKIRIVPRLFSIEESIRDAQVYEDRVREYGDMDELLVGSYVEEESTLILLFDDNINPLGYYLINPVEYNVSQITEGVSSIDSGKDSSVIKVDRSKLPDSAKNFTIMRVPTSDVPFDDNAIFNWINKSQLYDGMYPFNDEDGFAYHKDSKYKYAVVLLFDDNNNPLGYYKVP